MDIAVNNDSHVFFIYLFPVFPLAKESGDL